MKFIPEMHITL